MTTVTLDSDTIVSYVFKAEEYAKVREWMKQAEEGKVKLYIADLCQTFDDLEWALRALSPCTWRKAEIVGKLQHWLSLAQANPKAEKERVELALTLYSQAGTASFVDCLAVAESELSENSGN